jgi:hypothetical protein
VIGLGQSGWQRSKRFHGRHGLPKIEPVEDLTNEHTLDFGDEVRVVNSEYVPAGNVGVIIGITEPPAGEEVFYAVYLDDFPKVPVLPGDHLEPTGRKRNIYNE